MPLDKSIICLHWIALCALWVHFVKKDIVELEMKDKNEHRRS